MAGLHHLTPLQVKAAKPGEKLHDGEGLWLRVTSDTSARWAFRFTSPGGKRREMGLGSARGAGAVSLAAARNLAADARAKLATGVDPMDAAAEAKQAAQDAKAARAAVPTFEEAAAAFIALHETGWKNPIHRQQWRNTIRDYCGPIRDKKVDAITVPDVLAVMLQPVTVKQADGTVASKPLWRGRKETASRLRGRIEQILGANMAPGAHHGLNPAALANLKGKLPALRDEEREVKHQRALPYADVPAFVLALRGRQKEATAASAAEFLVLTAARTTEVLAATWREIDLAADGGPVWRVPGSRMKAKRPHNVPLSARALALLESVRPLTGGDPDAPLFPSPRLKGGKPVRLSGMALLVLLQRMGWAERTTMHGMRSAFRDWASENTSFPARVCEAALAHTVRDKTQAAYDRTDHLAARRKLMDAWAGWIEQNMAGGAGNVVRLSAAAGG